MRIKSILFATLFSGFFQANAEIAWVGNDVSVNFTDMTLEEALSEISEHTGIQIYASHPLDAKLQVGFDKVSIEKLMSQLLLGYNVSYMRNADNTIKEARIFAVGTAPKVVAKPQPAEMPDIAKNENGRFYVSVAINGTPVRLLVDTGASQLSISATLAARLGLQPTADNVVVETAAGKTQAYPTIIDDFAMAGKTLKGVQAIVLPQLKEDGLLGQNILAHFRRITEGDDMRFEPIEKALNQPNTTPQNAQKPIKGIPVNPSQNNSPTAN